MPKTQLKGPKIQANADYGPIFGVEDLAKEVPILPPRKEYFGNFVCPKSDKIGQEMPFLGKIGGKWKEMVVASGWAGGLNFALFVGGK